MVTRHAGAPPPRTPGLPPTRGGSDPTRLGGGVPAGTSSATLAGRYGYTRDPAEGYERRRYPCGAGNTVLTCWPEGPDDGGSEVPASARCRRWRPSAAWWSKTPRAASAARWSATRRAP